MALTDSGSGRKVRIAAGLTPEQVGGFPLLLSGTVKEGDPLGYSSGWVRADANATIYPVYVAGADGVAGETIFGYLLALVEGYTAGAPGEAVYLSDTAGRVSESAGTNKVRVGTVVDTTKAILAPALWGAVSTDVLISLTTMLSDWRKSTDLTKFDGADISAATIPSGSFVAGAIVNADIGAAAAIAYSKLATLASGNILVGSAGGVATSVAVSGDITLSNAGVAAIAAGVIIDADVNASAAIAYSKLAALASARLIVGSAANVATAVDVTGDVTISNAGVTAITADSIIDADVKTNAAVAWSKMAALTAAHILVGSAGGVATDVAVTGVIAISNTGVTSFTALSIVDADVSATAAIAWSKLGALTNGNILVGNGANVATSVAMTGDVTISNAGVTAIGAGKVTAAMQAERALQPHMVRLESLRQNDYAAMGIAETVNDHYLTSTMTLYGELANGNAKTDTSYFTFTLPENYVAAGDVKVRITATAITVGGAPALGATTIDCIVTEQNKDTGASGADLVSTAAPTLVLNTPLTTDFVVDGAALVAGDLLKVTVTSVITETVGAAATALVRISYIALLLDVK